MPKVKTTAPEPDREKGQRSLSLPEYLYRILPPWQQPEWFEASVWRRVVATQPLATICRDTLISYSISLDWKIEPRDSQKRDEYKSEIDYYSQFFQYTGDYDYTDIVDWILKDALDIPFGGAAEVGRAGDSSDGKVLWLELLDGGTLFPTLNSDWPVGQALREMPDRVIYFPNHAINRVFWSPRVEIKRKGWSLAPPEKIYLAMELLNRGDVYYANLLLDTPPAGILDLGDMEKTAAEAWISSWRNLLGGTDPFKIPVLYEHEKTVQFVPFTKNPADLMFDKATMKYAAILAAGYGLSLSDIGIQVASNGGETLAGSIRQERRTRKSGLSNAKKRMKAFFDRMLPSYLQFLFIDLDDETSVAIGRSRLANATAWSQLVTMGAFTAEEARQQTIADGLVSISVPETLPEEAKKIVENKLKPIGENPERPSMLGRPVAPSAGGQGEVRSDMDKLFSLSDVEPVRLKRLIRQVITPLKAEISQISQLLDDDGLLGWNEVADEYLWEGIDTDIPDYMVVSNSVATESLRSILSDDEWYKVDIDASLVAKSLIPMLRGIHKDNQIAIAERDYELGVTKSLSVPEYKPSIKLERKFISRVNKAASETLEIIPTVIEKAVIAGTRKYLSSLYNANSLDVETIMDDNEVVEYVRREIVVAIQALHNSFTSNVYETIRMILEDSR